MTDPTDPTDQTDDRQTAHLLRHATTDLTPDVDRLVAHGVTRGRVQRRRRRVGTTLAAAAVIGVVGVAASVGPGLLGDDGPASGDIGFADQPGPTGTAPTVPATSIPGESSVPTVPPSTEQPVDARIAVAAADIPATVADLLGDDELGATLLDPPYGIKDGADDKIVHFLWDGALTTVGIERADGLASCEELVAPYDGPGAPPDPEGDCVVQDGVELLVHGPSTHDQVTYQSVSAWVHGYVVSVGSYNAADGKDVAPVTAVPPISMTDLTALATSDAWFDDL